jgi:predicted alpha-1,2-mannosidase
MKIKYLFLLSLLATFSCASEQSKTGKNSGGDFTQYVNPFIGTAPLTDPGEIGYTPPEGWRVWAGLVFPGSSLPNAMVQLSPISEWRSGAGYEYEDEQILAFAHTNKGHWNLCNIPILPLSGDATAPYGSAFTHETEKASPAYYEVFLQDYGIKARLTSTLRAGIHEYTFENQEQKRLLFDLGRANNRISQWDIAISGDNEITGFQGSRREVIYFSAKLNCKVTKLDTVQVGERNGYAIVELDGEHSDPVILKIGLSYVSSENAAINLENEIGSSSFEEIHANGVKTWNRILSKIEVKGGTEKERVLFYSSFYRSLLWPALRSDVNGELTDAEGKIRQVDFNYYTVPSLWDTYRNKLVLLGLISPDVTRDVIKSLIDMGEIRGFIPTFFHGDHAAPFIAGSYLRGIKDFDVEKAYELLLNNAYKDGGTRPHITEYIEKGFISDPIIDNPHVETKAKAGVSKTLEYAYDDYSLALLAKELADDEHYKDLMVRSRNYENVFDTSTNFMRGRWDNGDWIRPFDPQYPYYEYMYREANAWQLSFYVPHDMPGLVQLYGGKEKFEEKLDSLFTFPWNPDHIARNVSSFIGQYCHGNQPDHEAPFSYYFVDKPGKSQAIIDNILQNYYGRGELGLALPGMDDAGEMSSWYVFCALGLYPLSAADDRYLVTVPVFEEVKWNLKDGKELLIQNTNGGRNLKNFKFNGSEQEGYFLLHDQFIKGGKLEINTLSEF